MQGEGAVSSLSMLLRVQAYDCPLAPKHLARVRADSSICRSALTPIPAAETLPDNDAHPECLDQIESALKLLRSFHGWSFACSCWLHGCLI